MKRSWILLLMIISLFVLFSCGGGGGGGGSDDEETNISSFKFLDISGAENLFVTSNTISSLSNTGTNSLPKMPYKEISKTNIDDSICYKITLDDEIIEVVIENANKEGLRYNGFRLVPTLVAPVNEIFFVIGFSCHNDIIPAHQFSFLVNKSNGKVFKLAETVGNCWVLETGGSKSLFQTDANNNMYYITFGNGVYTRVAKVNLSNFEFSYVTPPEIEQVLDFTVSDEGTVIYRGTLNTHSMYGVVAQDGRQKKSPEDIIISDSWKGTDGNLYFAQSYFDNNTSTYKSNIMKINLNNLEPEIFMENSCGGGLYTTIADKTYFVGANNIYEINYDTRTITSLPISPNIGEECQVDYVCSTDSDIYIARHNWFTNDKYDLVKINPETGVCQSIITRGYEVSAFTISNGGGKITLAATDSRDKKQIIGVVSPFGGGVKVLFHFNGSSILTLQSMK